MLINLLISTLFSSLPLIVHLHVMQNDSKTKLMNINFCYSNTWKIPRLIPCFQPRPILNQIISHTSFTHNQAKTSKTNMNGKQITFSYSPIHLVPRYLNFKDDDSSERMQSYIDTMKSALISTFKAPSQALSTHIACLNTNTAEKIVDDTFFISIFFPSLRPFSKTLMSLSSSIALYEH